MKQSLVNHIIEVITDILREDINEPKTANYGVILSDISDHFITFATYASEPNKPIAKTIKTRDFSENNMTQFQQTLNGFSWNHVTLCNDTNSAFDEFFQTFVDLIELYFPLRKIKFNKNTMGINNFMTSGLLIFRSHKNKLHLNYL